MKNYLRWKMVGGPKFIKEGVVPHKFECQADRNLTTPRTAVRSGAEKKERKQYVDDALRGSAKQIQEEAMEISNLTEENISEDSQERIQNKLHRRDIGVNVKPYFRSKQTQTTCQVVSKTCSPLGGTFRNSEISLCPEEEAGTSNTLKRKLSFSDSFTSSESSATDSTVSLYEPPGTGTKGVSDSETNSTKTIQDEQFCKLAYEHTLRLILGNSKRYIGLNNDCMYVIDLLKKHVEVDTKRIYLTLQKLKLAQSFGELADAYGVSESTASRIFSKTISLISTLLNELIIWPSSDKIKKQLPITFRVRYSNVQCIIDCLEIEIQKPKDAVKQALTCSEYKKANTIKYLISATPDGIINFISHGYGGRTSDAVIVGDCGFLDKLQPGTGIMADRGFKHIEKLIVNKKCVLIRPPSVSQGNKLEKVEVLRTKQIASLRIHIERVIRRLREYRLLRPHSCVHHKTIPFMDDAVIVACGLINLQGPIVK